MSTPVRIGRRDEPPRVPEFPHVPLPPMSAVTRNRRLATFVLSTWVKRTVRPTLHIRPIAAELFLTDNCNLQCISCTCWHDHTLDELTAEEWYSVIDQLAALGFIKLNFTGGEALVRRDAVRIIAHAKAAGFTDLHVNSNGLLLDIERADELIAAGVRSFNISIDGPTSAIHDPIRGREGAFDITLTNLQQLLSRRDDDDLAIRMNFTVLKDNCEYLPAMARLAQDLGVDLYLNLGTDTTFLFRDATISEQTEVDADALRAALQEVRRMVDQDPGHLPPKRELDYIPGHFAIEPKIDVPCVESQLKLMIRSTGETGGCWGHDATTNVRTSSIEDIISAPHYREEHAKLFAKDCVQCGSNYAVNLRTEPRTAALETVRSLRHRSGRTKRERGRT